MDHDFEIVRGLLDEAHCDLLIMRGLKVAPRPLPDRLPMPHRVSGDFLEVMKLPKIVEIVRERLGDCDGLGSDFFYHPPGVDGMARHVDNTYVQAPPESFLSVWIALTDVNKENGCLYAEEPIELNKGDAVLIGQQLPHCSLPNNSDGCRFALLLTYLKHGATFRPGNTQKRTRVPL